MRRTNRHPHSRKLNRFSIVLDTLMAVHKLDEGQLLKALKLRRDRRTIRTIQSWRAGKTRPGTGRRLNLLEKIEAKFEMPVGRLTNLAGGRASTFYRAVRKLDIQRKDLITWHTPDDFDLRPEAQRQEIMDWIGANVLPCGTAFGKYQSKSTRHRFAVVFPSLPRKLGGREWLASRLKNRTAIARFNRQGTVPAPSRLAREMSQIVAFHTAQLPPKGFRRRKRWSHGTTCITIRRIGFFLGALAAPPNRSVKGLGVPVSDLTVALYVFPEILEWYLQWSEKRRGFFSSTDQSVLYDARLLTRKPTGWIRQHPRIARSLKPIDGVLTQRDINKARANWSQACDKASEHASLRAADLKYIIRIHRDPFASILPVLANVSPLGEYKKIGDEIIRRMPHEQTHPMRNSTAVRNYLIFRLALHLGLRQRNLRELLISFPGQKPRDTPTLEKLERGEMRWDQTEKIWQVIVPAVAIKNGYASFFRGRPYQAVLPDLENLYAWIESYLQKHRPRLLNNNPDPGTFFVRTLREVGPDPEFNLAAFHSVWRNMIAHHGIYNPYTKRGAIKGLLPHGPHAVRDVLATHLLKTTGSYDLASYAIQDSVASVVKHYSRFMPQEKIAKAAEELNKVYQKSR